MDVSSVCSLCCWRHHCSDSGSVDTARCGSPRKCDCSVSTSPAAFTLWLPRNSDSSILQHPAARHRRAKGHAALPALSRTHTRILNPSLSGVTINIWNVHLILKSVMQQRVIHVSRENPLVWRWAVVKKHTPRVLWPSHYKILLSV